MERVALLQALRLKGRAQPDGLARAIGLPSADVERSLAELSDAAFAERTASGWRLTLDGRAALDEALTAELATVDQSRLGALYDGFCVLNDEVKQVIADWQLRTVDSEQVLNDHTDQAYDAGIVSRLADVHRRAVDLVERVSAEVPRLTRYGQRLGDAVEAVEAGDARFVAGPMVDSYHTVWFELHEELILANGRTRAEEAEAGRAV